MPKTRSRKPANPDDDPSTSTPAFDMDNPGPSTSQDEPGPSTSTPAFANDTHGPSTSQDEPGPSTSTLATAAGHSHDSDWDLSDDDDDDLDSDYEPENDSDLELEEMVRDVVPLDYVASHDTSIDSDEPLSEAARRQSLRNAPGSAGWRGWFREENVPRRHGFSGTPGVDEALGLEEDSTPKEIFDCFFPPELWNTMATETNRYATQHPMHLSSHMKAWENATVEELEKYVGLRLLMGIQPRPTYRHYWSSNPLVSSPVFSETMTRDRYAQLTANLHFSDNEDPTSREDRLWKLRPVVSTLQRTFKEVFTPERKISIDESLWAYRGRHHAVQYNPSKRARFGMKAYKLCSSDGKAAGYTAAFKVYMGQDRSEVPASMKAVTDLMHAAGLFEKGYQLYLDNWYSSPTLFHYLQSRKTEAIGTARLTRRFMPKDLTVRERGDTDVRTSGSGMLAMAWKDKKQVNMLSTVHRGDEWVQLPPNRRGEVRTKPGCIVDYNNGMKGVDLSDQVAQSYPVARKSNKWYIKLFYNLLDMAVVNTHAVHKWLGGRMTQLDFRLELISQLLRHSRRARSRSRSRSRSPSLPRSPHHRNVRARRQTAAPSHTLVKTDGGRYRRCRYCRDTRALRRQSRFKCAECDVALCAACFSDYHASLNT